MFYFASDLGVALIALALYFNFMSHCTSIVVVLTACNEYARPEADDEKANTVVKVIYNGGVQLFAIDRRRLS